MRRLHKIALVIIFSLCLIRLSEGNDFCGQSNLSFSSGEVISYKIFYIVIGLYVDAVTASFSVSNERLNAMV